MTYRYRLQVLSILFHFFFRKSNDLFDHPVYTRAKSGYYVHSTYGDDDFLHNFCSVSCIVRRNKEPYSRRPRIGPGASIGTPRPFYYFFSFFFLLFFIPSKVRRVEIFRSVFALSFFQIKLPVEHFFLLSVFFPITYS